MTKRYIKSHYIRFLLFIYILLASCHAIHAQAQQPKYTLILKNATLKECIEEIEKLTGYSFIYGEEVTIKHPITLKANQKTLTEILDLAFINSSISFEIKGKHILLQIKKTKIAARKFTISGYVTDHLSSETMIGANIIDRTWHKGATTNPFGFYSITLPEGEVCMLYSYIGYDTQQHIFALQKDTVLNVSMSNNNKLEEVVIVSDKTESGITSTHMSSIDIPVARIKNTPTVLGESDVLKTIQMMPGVHAGVEGSAGIHVRGGGPDQNLFLLDGVPVYSVDHLFGFFSVFSPEAIKKVTLFKGSFPARFGGRLSSVIDIRTNDGDMKNYHGMVSVGLLTTKFQFEGPIIKDKTSFNVSARRTYLDWIIRPFMSSDEKFKYNFYDINAKVNHRFSDRMRLYLSFYNGNDNYGVSFTDNNESYYLPNDMLQTNKDKMRSNWGNLIGSARLNYIFNQKLFCNATVAYNKYQVNIHNRTYSSLAQSKIIAENLYEANYKSSIRDWMYQLDFDYNPMPTQNIKFGFTYQRHNFHPEVSSSKIKETENNQVIQDTVYHDVVNRAIRAHEWSAYIEDNFNIGNHIRANIGLHLSAFNVNRKTYLSAQPRISARYQMNKHIAWKASYTQMQQYIHLLTSSMLSMPTDLWVPVTNNIKPMTAHQYSIGGYYVGLKGWELSVEAYYKKMYRILEYKEGSSFFGSSAGWEDKVESGNGRSMGIEFMLEKLSGKTTGWIAYTLAKSDRKFASGGINNGQTFPFKYDHRHAVDLVVNHKFNNRIDISASWMFASGGTASIAKEVTGVLRPDKDAVDMEDFIEQRNNYRLPPTHRLSLGINFRKKIKRGERIWNISVYNAYNAMNPDLVYNTGMTGYYYMEYDPTTQETTTHYIPGEPKLTKVTMVPLIPSVSYTFKF